MNKKFFLVILIIIFLLTIIKIVVDLNSPSSSVQIATGTNNTDSEYKIKILVERHTDFLGDAAYNEGTSKFIASDGYVYEYKYCNLNSSYNTYSNYSYPEVENLTELSDTLISKAIKTEIKLTDEELKLVKECIKNVEQENEAIKVIESSESLIVIPDAINTEDFGIFNYTSNKFMEINPEKKGAFYESPSITKLFNIVKKYI